MHVDVDVDVGHLGSGSLHNTFIRPHQTPLELISDFSFIDSLDFHQLTSFILPVTSNHRASFLHAHPLPNQFTGVLFHISIVCAAAVAVSRVVVVW